jgi:hypothetical protein
MWNIPNEEQLSQIPKLYETEHISLEDKIIYQHFFIFGCDWFICEYDGEDLFWGFCILNQDLFNSEWGYISLAEMQSLNIGGIETDTDLYWKQCPAIDVDKIRKGNNWEMPVKGKDHAKSEELPDAKRESSGYGECRQVSSMS